MAQTTAMHGRRWLAAAAAAAAAYICGGGLRKLRKLRKVTMQKTHRCVIQHQIKSNNIKSKQTTPTPTSPRDTYLTLPHRALRIEVPFFPAAAPHPYTTGRAFGRQGRVRSDSLATRTALYASSSETRFLAALCVFFRFRIRIRIHTQHSTLNTLHSTRHFCPFRPFLLLLSSFE